MTKLINENIKLDKLDKEEFVEMLGEYGIEYIDFKKYEDMGIEFSDFKEIKRERTIVCSIENEDYHIEPVYILVPSLNDLVNKKNAPCEYVQYKSADIRWTGLERFLAYKEKPNLKKIHIVVNKNSSYESMQTLLDMIINYDYSKWLEQAEIIIKNELLQ